MASGGKGKGKGGGKGDEFESAGRTICAHVGCDQPGELRCVRCKTVLYCSQEHQRLHWKEGGHKRHCTPAPTAAATATADAAPPPPPSTSGPAVVGVLSPTTVSASASPRKLCGACRVPKPVAAFSNSQLKKKAKRRCLECFEAGRLVAEAVNP